MGKPGRPRKLARADIVVDAHGQQYVVVDYESPEPNYRGYRVIRLDGMHRRYGAAIMMLPQHLRRTGKRSKIGSLLTYKANKKLDEELEGRGCDCQCCIHTAMPKRGFNPMTGEFRYGQE